MVLMFLALSGCLEREEDIRIFEDVTLKTPLIDHAGMTHGAAWGDYDNDGKPDLWLTNHLNQAQLYKNLGNGQFKDVTHELFDSKDLGRDKHGAQWADFDNDGDLDLVQLTGAVRGVGQEPKQLFRNVGNRFEEIGKQVGIANLSGRTRIPLWVDLNGDSHLDLFQGAEQRLDDQVPPFIFLQDATHQFTGKENLVQFATKAIPFCILTQLNDEVHPEMVCRVAGRGAKRTVQIFDTSTLPPHELDLLPVTAFEDIAAGDFDNDGRIDLFLARKSPPPPVVWSNPGNNELMVDLKINSANQDRPLGLKFHTTGHMNVQAYPAWPHDGISPQAIFLGRQGIHPPRLMFPLSRETSGVEGLVNYTPGADSALYIGMTGSDTWEIRASADRKAFETGTTQYQNIHIHILSTEPITQIEPIGSPDNNTKQAPARLFMNLGNKFVEESDKRGINNRLVAGSNVVTGDFDNDMDLDLFILASGVIGNQENLLLLNRGNGHFNPVKYAGGAAGNKKGVGDSVTTADYDGDGFLDLLIANGGSMGRSLGLPSSQGYYRLYHNIGNTNHWIEIDLEGKDSNRDGIGAVVRLTAGGITQTRVQDGGLHNRSQNHARLHFGLAQNTKIDKISIHWPSGKNQILKDLEADQIIRIRESESYLKLKPPPIKKY